MSTELDYDADYADHQPSNATCPHCDTALQITLPAHLSVVVVSPGKSQLEIARERFPKWEIIQEDDGRLTARRKHPHGQHHYIRYQYDYTLEGFLDIIARTERSAGLEH